MLHTTQHYYQMCACAEIDSHADTTPAGAHFVLLEVTKKVCDVGSFHDSMELIKGVSVGTCDKVYSHLDLIQETIKFCFLQALFFGKRHGELPYPSQPIV
jgi:hypothetical protein